MSLIRLPLAVTQSERVRVPQKRRPESWSNVIGGGLIIIAIFLFLVFILAPLLEQ